MAPKGLIDIHKENLYDLLGVASDATTKQISTAYRKTALKFHPDKNPDPAAHEQFLKYTQIMELLSNEESRANYDTVLKAREAARLRTQKLDAKRRKLKEALEEKEQRAFGGGGGASVSKAEESLAEQIKKLQAEGENLMKREEEKMRDAFFSRASTTIADRATVKLKWKCKKDDKTNGGYSEPTLRGILSRYGPVSDIVVSAKRNGSAVAVFESIAAAKICQQKEKGLEGCPFSIRILHDTDTEEQQQPPPPPPPSSGQFSSFPSFSSFQSAAPPPVSKVASNGELDRDYESLTLMRLRQAEERKRLIAEMQEQEQSRNHDEGSD